MSMSGIDDSGDTGERPPLRARLIAEADVITISPPPTLAVRAAGTRMTRRRRALQVTSGVAVVCAIGVAAVLWSPGKTAAGPSVTAPSPQAASATSASPGSPSTSSIKPTSSWPTDYAADLPGYVRTADLGPGWVGPYVIPAGNVSPGISTLSNCAGVSIKPVQAPAFRIYNRTDYTNALVETVEQFPPGKAADVMSALRSSKAEHCVAGFTLVQDTPPAGDDSVVYGEVPDPADGGLFMLFIRSGDKIAYVSTDAMSSSGVHGTTWRDALLSVTAARLTGH